MTDVTDSTALRLIYAEPKELVRKKVAHHLNAHARHFISLSPFLTIASASPTGTDCSPRGDAPGFVAVVDDHTLLIPDRRGNNLLDTLQNVLASPAVGLLFFVPGISETLRINGQARIVSDPARLSQFAIRETIIPATAIEVSVEHVYFHCGRALIRSQLWNSERHIDRSAFPSLGTVLADQIAGVDAVKTDDILEVAYTTNLY